MSLILRADVDKPYGHSNLLRKVASKWVEDYFPIPVLGTVGYLSHLIEFLEYCNSVNVPGFIYHRTCTSPNARVSELLLWGKHKVCFHAENTRSFETFSEELNAFKKTSSPVVIESFTKHGSGKLKLGKYHYPAYEPEKYKIWSAEISTGFYFGNGIAKNENDLFAANAFFTNMFWMERDYRDPGMNDLQQLLDAAKKQDVVVLIHPCNFHSSKVVSSDFKQLVTRASEQNVSWKVY
jgi:hypothetical protein